MKKRILSILLCLCMVLALCPVTAFAEEPTITITGPDMVCAQQKYEFTVTASDGVTIIDAYLWENNESTPDIVTLTEGENNELRGNVPAQVYSSLNRDSFVLRVTGTMSGKLVDAIKIVTISQEHIFKNGVCGCGAKQLTVRFQHHCGTLTDEWKDEETLVIESENVIELPGLEKTCDEHRFLGWQILGSDDTTLYPAGTRYSLSEDITFVAVYENKELNSYTIPFTTTVKLGGDVAPGEKTFELKLIGDSAPTIDKSDVSITGSVTTNGKGSYNGTLTITGPQQTLWYMLSEGAFVQQVDDGEEGWTVDDTVWGLLMSQIAAYSMDDAAAGYAMYVVPASIDGNGDYYIDWDNLQSADMTFTNIYTKSEAGTAEPEETTNGDSDNDNDSKTDSDNDSKTDTEDSVKTGDDANLALWIALLLLSGIGITGAGSYTRRKRTNEKI